MRNLRSTGLLVLFGGVLFLSTRAGAAQNYLMTGKFARSNGPVINIPLIGENPGGVPNCGRTLMGGTMIPGVTPIYQRVKSDITMTMVATPPISQIPIKFANPQGCISITAPLVATAPGTGKAFVMPSMAFSKPHPGMTVAVHVPLQGNIPQLATSWKVTGPPMSLVGPNGTMNNMANTAIFRFFHKDAYKSQTGRAGAKFTWCFGNPGCTKVSQAQGYPTPIVNPVHQLIVKYTPGPNKFGGTMSHVAHAGTNPSSLAVTAAGVVQFLGLAGIGEAGTGRGYAEYHRDALMGGPAYAMFMLGTVYVPQLMSVQTLITTVMTGVPAKTTLATVTINKVFGFPFTTGTVLARNTGTTYNMNPIVVTLTGMGYDCVNAKGTMCSQVTGMGARNISLVAGGVAGIDTLATEYPSLNQMFLPEPGSPAQLITGAVALLGIAVWRARARNYRGPKRLAVQRAA